MAEARERRKLAAILAADVAGYSRLMEADETGTLRRLKAARAEVVDPAIAENRGRIVKTTGDGMLCEFASAVDAVHCAVAVQEAMATRDGGADEDRRLRFRVGVNIGDIIIDGDDIFGDGVNIAARLERLAEPGGLCVSGTVLDQVRNKLDVAFRDGGEQRVKNIERPITVWRWAPGAAAALAMPRQDALPLPDKPAIAVLPFDNMSGDPEQEYFSDGITEDIITALSKFRWLFVIARNSTFAYKGAATDVRRVASELGVGYVVEGSVRRAGSRVRITAQLIDAETGNHLWAEKYDREMTDIFDLQDEITRLIVATIEPELASSEQDRARRKPTEDMTAWDLFLRGLWHRWRFSLEDYQEAQRLFQAAVDIDPNLAAAHAHLAYLGYGMIMLGWADDRDAILGTALADARRAVSLDPRDAMGHCSLGFVLSPMGEGEAAIREFNRALELNANLALAHYGLAIAKCFSLGARDSAGVAEAAGMAMRLSPNDPMMWGYLNIRAIARFLSNDLDTALADFRRSCDLPNAPHVPYLGMAACLVLQGDLDQARKAVERARQKYPDLSVSKVSNALGPEFSGIARPLFEAVREAGVPD